MGCSGLSCPAQSGPKGAARFLAVALTRHAMIRDASGMIAARVLQRHRVESSGRDGDTPAQWVEQHLTDGAAHVPHRGVLLNSRTPRTISGAAFRGRVLMTTTSAGRPQGATCSSASGI